MASSSDDQPGKRKKAENWMRKITAADKPLTALVQGVAHEGFPRIFGDRPSESTTSSQAPYQASGYSQPSTSGPPAQNYAGDQYSQNYPQTNQMYTTPQQATGYQQTGQHSHDPSGYWTHDGVWVPANTAQPTLHQTHQSGQSGQQPSSGYDTSGQGHYYPQNNQGGYTGYGGR